MSDILSLAQRPKTLSALYGQKAMVDSIRAMMAKRTPRVWMFYGASGTGKTTTTEILAVSFQCQHMKLWGDPCEECWRKWSSFAIHDINASDDTGVEKMRQVIELSRFRPTYDGKRVIIINECHKLSDSGQKALLVPTEKAGEHVVWIFCTTEPDKMIDTLRKRCVKFQLKGLGISTSEDFLKRAAAKAGVKRPLDELFEQCHLMQVNAPRDLLMALEKWDAGASAADAVSGVESGVDALRICKAVTSGKWAEVVECLKSMTPDAARLVRASTCGWLVGCMKRARTPLESERAATGIIELSDYPLDDAAMSHWLWGVLYKACKRYRQEGR